MGTDGGFRKRQNPFAQVSNEALHNTELSCKARGLYAIIQSYITIIWLLFKFSSMLITVVVIGRMVEIYIYTAIAAVPIATLGGGDLGMIGKNFLKSFAAVCVQGVLIYIAMSMFGTLAVSIPNGGLAGGDVTGVLFQCLLYSFVLVMAVFSSGRLAKSICNAM